LQGRREQAEKNILGADLIIDNKTAAHTVHIAHTALHSHAQVAGNCFSLLQSIFRKANAGGMRV